MSRSDAGKGDRPRPVDRKKYSDVGTEYSVREKRK